MQRIFLSSLATSLLLASLVHGQSLGDVARRNRAKKADEVSAPAPKVITNKDLAKDAAANEPASDQTPANGLPSGPSLVAKPANPQAEHRTAQQSIQRRLAEQRRADRWKSQILEQKNRIAMLQSRADQLNAAIRSDYGTVQYEAPYSRPQARKLERVAQLQEQIEEQKSKLAEMQEAARRAGMHTAVYDP